MKSSNWRKSTSSISRISVISILAFGAVFAILQVRNLNNSKAATSLCYGHPGTQTVVAPTSVIPGQRFKLTNISGTGNTDIATVNEVSNTWTISGASPTSVNEKWAGGPVHGDFITTFNDISLTANGPVGSQIDVNLISITAQTLVSGVSVNVVCSVANGQLLANNPGESLRLATINIVAPPPSPKPTPTQSSTHSAPTTSPSSSPSSSPNNTTSNQSITQNTSTAALANQQITITVQDHSGKPIQGAQVVLDSQPKANTDSAGKVSYKNVSIGSHNISVTAEGHTITREVQVTAQPNGNVLGLQVQLPGPKQAAKKSIIGIIAGLLVLGLLIIWLIRRSRAKKQLAPPTLSTPLVISSPVDPGTSSAGQIIIPTPASPPTDTVAPTMPSNPPKTTNIEQPNHQGPSTPV